MENSFSTYDFPMLPMCPLWNILQIICFYGCAKERDKDFTLSFLFVCFLQLLLLPTKCKGFVVISSFSFPDFLQIREVDANVCFLLFLWKTRFASNKGRIMLTLIF